MKQSKEENFRIITNILIKEDIFFWIDQGTLLGYQRNGKLIDWDTDIDISVWGHDFEKVKGIVSLFEEEGYFCDVQEGKDAIYLSDGAQHFIEIVRLQKKGELVYRNNSQRNGVISKRIKKFISFLPNSIHLRIKKIARSPLLGKKLVAVTPAEYFSSFKKTTFLDVYPIHVPERTVDYLIFKYGENWKKPNKEWNYLKNDGSILLAQRKE